MFKEYDPNEHGQPSSIVYIDTGVKGVSYILNAYQKKVIEDFTAIPMTVFKFTSGYAKTARGIESLDPEEELTVMHLPRAKITKDTEVINEKLKEFGISIDDLITEQDDD